MATGDRRLHTDRSTDARTLSFWRGITESGGFLALAYEHRGQLPEALKAVDEAIDANTHIPDELYFVPKNLAIKAEIKQKLGNAKESDELYRKSAALIDVMLAHAPTQNVERIVLGEMGSVYSGYFASLCAQKKYDSAFRVLRKLVDASKPRPCSITERLRHMRRPPRNKTNKTESGSHRHRRPKEARANHGRDLSH